MLQTVDSLYKAPSILIRTAVDLDVSKAVVTRNTCSPSRSWVVGWTHRVGLSKPSDSFAGFEDNEFRDAHVRRLVEAVVDVLLERRSADQVRRWVSREVFNLLTIEAPRREPARFAPRATIRLVRLHQPAPGAVESTVLVQDGSRVRAVALRFDRLKRSPPSTNQPDSEWCCTALQVAR